MYVYSRDNIYSHLPFKYSRSAPASRLILCVFRFHLTLFPCFAKAIEEKFSDNIGVNYIRFLEELQVRKMSNTHDSIHAVSNLFMRSSL